MNMANIAKLAQLQLEISPEIFISPPTHPHPTPTKTVVQYQVQILQLKIVSLTSSKGVYMLLLNLV